MHPACTGVSDNVMAAKRVFQCVCLCKSLEGPVSPEPEGPNVILHYLELMIHFLSFRDDD